MGRISSIVGASAKYIVSGAAGLCLLASSAWAPSYYIVGGVANAMLSELRIDR